MTTARSGAPFRTLVVTAATALAAAVMSLAAPGSALGPARAEAAGFTKTFLYQVGEPDGRAGSAFATRMLTGYDGYQVYCRGKVGVPNTAQWVEDQDRNGVLDPRVDRRIAGPSLRTASPTATTQGLPEGALPAFDRWASGLLDSSISTGPAGGLSGRQRVVAFSLVPVDGATGGIDYCHVYGLSRQPETRAVPVATPRYMGLLSEMGSTFGLPRR